MNSFYAGLSIRGELVNTWSTQYDDKTGTLDLHSDKFSYCQQARSIFTQGSSRCGKYIRFQERGKGRWVELWLPHGSLYTLDKHGSGADVPRDENGHPVKESIANAEGVPIVQHAIFGAQRTNASFLEWRPQKGSSFDQVLGDLHGALPASPVVNCYVHPPLPTKSQVGQKGCVEMSLSEKASLRISSKTEYGDLKRRTTCRLNMKKKVFTATIIPTLLRACRPMKSIAPFVIRLSFSVKRELKSSGTATLNTTKNARSMDLVRNMTDKYI